MESLVLIGLLALPAAVALGCLALRTPRQVLWAAAVGTLGFVGLAVWAAALALGRGIILGAGGWFFLDALSAYHLLVMALVFGLSALYALCYFRRELRDGALPLRAARQYGALFCASLAAMALVLVSNNLGVMWIGIEATTLLTAFLICVHLTPTSLEAMWKYLLVCSVGVAFAFVGTLLTGSSAAPLKLGTTDSLLWTHLAANSARLEPMSIKAAFLFLLVGYGTKAGLAPMHGWLPDAHSQAPAPVSAIFSGFMLSAALYCVMRYVPLVEGASGNSGWSRSLLVGFGLLSIVIGAAFIVFQHDLKRLLAYSSVEHLGIIALGVGLGGLGTAAALFHTLNHSVCKSLAFFSAGRLGQRYQSHDMGTIAGALRVSPAWGAGMLGSLLALIGVAPFALFMSKFQLLQAAAASGSWWALGIFLGGAAVVFVGALRHALGMAWGEPKTAVASESQPRAEALLAWGPLALLLLLGLWMPETLRQTLDRAAAVIGGPR
jgi:hydrogenase-4 component F